MSASRNARASTRDRLGKDGFTRTAVVTRPGNGTSLDIVDEGGALVARVNVFTLPTDGFSIDVIPQIEDQRPASRCVIWTSNSLDKQIVQNVSLVAIAIRKDG